MYTFGKKEASSYPWKPVNKNTGLLQHSNTADKLELIVLSQPHEPGVLSYFYLELIFFFGSYSWCDVSVTWARFAINTTARKLSICAVFILHVCGYLLYIFCFNTLTAWKPTVSIFAGHNDPFESDSFVTFVIFTNSAFYHLKMMFRTFSFFVWLKDGACYHMHFI